MPRSHAPARTDSNQAAIVAALRGVGARVALTHVVGYGFPDLLVGFRGINYLLEIKNIDGRNRLTPAEVIWLEHWRGQVAIVRSPDEALRVIGAIGG